MPRTSTCGDWMRSKRVCMLLPPGPEQSWLMMILRRDCALAGEMDTRSARASARKRRTLPSKITLLLSPLPLPPFCGSVDPAGVKVPHPGSADSKGVTGGAPVSADSKGLMKMRDVCGWRLAEYMTDYNL